MMHLPRLLRSAVCSSQCRCAAPSHGMPFPNGTARPVLGGAAGSPLPSLLGATAFPGTSSHLRLLTPITGPQACHVLACSDPDVERRVFRVASNLCLKHLLYCVLSCCLLFPQTRKKPRFWEPSLILFT